MDGFGRQHQISSSNKSYLQDWIRNLIRVATKQQRVSVKQLILFPHLNSNQGRHNCFVN